MAQLPQAVIDPSTSFRQHQRTPMVMGLQHQRKGKVPIAMIRRRAFTQVRMIPRATESIKIAMASMVRRNLEQPTTSRERGWLPAGFGITNPA